MFGLGIRTRVNIVINRVLSPLDAPVFTPAALLLAQGLAWLLSTPLFRVLPGRNALFAATQRLLWRIHNWIIAAERRLKLDIKMGRRFYGNDARLTNNTIGRLNIAWARACSGYQGKPTAAVARQSRELNETGFITLPAKQVEPIVSKVHRQFTQLIDDEDHSLAGCVGNRSIVEVGKCIPEIKDLLTDEIAGVIRDYYGSYFRVYQAVFYRNRHVSSDVLQQGEVYSNFWHCDRNPTDTIAVFFALHDITANHGPFHVRTLQRTRAIMNLGFHDRLDYRVPLSVLENPQEITQLTGPAGTTMIWKVSCCLHRAGIPATGLWRDMGQFLMLPSKEPLRDDWVDHLEPTLAEQRYFRQKLAQRRSGQRIAA